MCRWNFSDDDNYYNHLKSSSLQLSSLKDHQYSSDKTIIKCMASSSLSKLLVLLSLRPTSQFLKSYFPCFFSEVWKQTLFEQNLFKITDKSRWNKNSTAYYYVKEDKSRHQMFHAQTMYFMSAKYFTRKNILIKQILSLWCVKYDNGNK